ncbi:MAG: trigger factor [Planctomycetota bacterium]|nr:trigger factor [Planctomycetota bacterium]
MSTEETTATAEAPVEKVNKLNLDVQIDDVGPCRKHVRVIVPRSDIDTYHSKAIEQIIDSETIPGFRKGHVPQKLVEKKFRTAITDQIKQQLLVESLEQVAETHELDPINEPDFDLETIELPEDGDFEYEFEVEVRPSFALPDFSSIVIDRPTREITDQEVGAHLDQFLAQFGELEAIESAEANDYVTINATLTHNGQRLREMDDLTVQLKPVLRFHDAEVSGFDELMTGAKAGDVREVDITISTEAELIKMRGETVHAKLNVEDVKRRQNPDMNKEFFQRIGVETVEEMEELIRGNLESQLLYEQRQSARSQVLAQITESADWDLPEQLVLRQVENALRREMLEMQQAGYSQREIAARESQMRQNAVSTTREALKEHFVLDKIATEQTIEVSNADIEQEISNMAMRQGESPRRLRARMEKSGVIENLEAQIREMKAIDYVLEHVKFEDKPGERTESDNVFAVSVAIGASVATTTSDAVKKTAIEVIKSDSSEADDTASTPE